MQQAALKEDDLYYTDAPVGDVLRHVREHYGQTLRDVEKALRIRAIQIEAIEKSDYDKLPGRVYAIGFIRTYSEYLGLDPDRMVNMFKSQGAEHAKAPILHFPVAASDGKLPDPFLIAGCVICLIVFFASAGSFFYNQPSPLSVIEPVSAAALNPASTLIGPLAEEIYGPPAPNTLNRLFIDPQPIKQQ